MVIFVCFEVSASVMTTILVTLLNVLLSIVKANPNYFKTIEGYVDRKFGDWAEYISAHPSERRVTFAPSVFKVPDVSMRNDLVAIMMPFAGFDCVHAAIKAAAADAGMNSQ